MSERAAERGRSWELQPVRSRACQRPPQQAGSELLPGQPRESAFTGRVIENQLLSPGPPARPARGSPSSAWPFQSLSTKCQGPRREGHRHGKPSRQKAWARPHMMETSPLSQQS